jgi:hypothetical protein
MPVNEHYTGRDRQYVDAKDFDAVKSELAEIKESLAYRGSLLNRTQQRAEAAEQRNAELAELLASAGKVIEQFMPNVGKCFGIDYALLNETMMAITALKPTESGASE